MAVTKLPPAKNEKAVQKFLNGAGKTKRQAVVPHGPSEFRQINVKLLESEGEQIDQLRELRPKPRGGKRLGISLHDWIIEAIQEKLQRDLAKAKTQD